MLKLSGCFMAMLALAVLASADPVVSNVTVAQRTDSSGLVDVHYDLSGVQNTAMVSLIISNDNGTNWTIIPQASLLLGDVGPGIGNGKGKHIIWDAARDRAGAYWPQARARIVARDPSQNLTLTLPGGIPLEMVWVPSGSYQMGRNTGEVDGRTNEDPQHPVTLAYGFWMGKYEITQQQWLAVQGSWPGTAPSATYGVGNTYPAYYISWDDAKNFITTLNAYIISSGQGPLMVRLPSEAEWEYACRGGTSTRFYFGDSLGCDGLCADCAASVLPSNRSDYMWYCGNNGASGTPTYGTKAVGGKTANAFGLYDMSGNVYEWCEDDYHANYTGAPTDGSAWIDSPRGSNRTVRGGDWNYYARNCRSAFRSDETPDCRNYVIGFRLAADQ